MSDVQNIVVIGGNTAGREITNLLQPNLPRSYRILLIDANAFGMWPIASLRASVKSDWENKLTGPLTTETIFPAGTQHQVIAPNKVVELRESEVVLEKPFEGSTVVPFFKAVIATGSSQPQPMRPVPGSSEEEYRQLLVSNQRDFAKATKVVIVGGGAVGVELAGEIREAHPDTTITIVHSLPQLLNATADPVDPKANLKSYSWSSPPTPLKQAVSLHKQLLEAKIDVILGDKVSIPSAGSRAAAGAWDGKPGATNGEKTVKLASGKTLQADYVFIAIGNKPNTEIVEKADPGAIAGSSKLVAVNEYLKVVSSSPNSILTKNYYAIGDASSTPGWKTSQGATLDAKAASVNILADIKSTSPTVYDRPKPWALFVPIGSQGKGYAALVVPIFGVLGLPSFALKMGKATKMLLPDLFYSTFKGSEQIPAVSAEPKL